MTPTLLTGETYSAVIDAANRMEHSSDTPLYRVAADWLNSPNPGVTTERIEQQISFAEPAGATLMIEEADAFFASRDATQLASGEPMVDWETLVKRFAEAGVPLIFTLKDEELARKIADKTGWILTVAG